MKIKKEQNTLKKDVENVSRKLQELTPEELEQISGKTISGFGFDPSMIVAGRSYAPPTPGPTPTPGPLR